jgi:hypothetical protein
MNERFEQLVTGIVLPLVLGGKLTLARPFGASALTVGQNARLLDPDARTNLDVARVRRARLLAPVDYLPELNEADWAIAAVLNDLLQVTNHNLAGALTKSRYSALLQSCASVCTRVAPARDVGEVIARHATFARVMELFRTDTTVSWWTGSSRFRGEEPPSRLLAWRNWRRVRIDSDRVPLARMADNLSASDDFLQALSMWLQLSPLTDLATMTRDAPTFVWSPSTIGLIAVPSGRTLVFRALARANTDVVTTALNNARSKLLPNLAAQQAIVDEFSLAVIHAFTSHRSRQTA